jgi:serine/threonine protein phosphatase PrpC
MPATLTDFRFAPCFDVAVASRIGVDAPGVATRAENQDNFVVIDFDGHACLLRDQQPQHLTLPHWPSGHGRLAVLDGMGGHGHGREAAQALAAALLDVPPCDSLDELSSRLDAVHAELQARFAADASGVARPGTTLTLLELRPHGAPLLYHVGDSRLYRLTRERATPLTVDHVPATVAALAGRLDEAGWRAQVYGHHAPQIAQAFILGNAFADPARLSDPLFALTPANLPAWLSGLPDRRLLPVEAGNAYLLATDGFWSCAEPGQVLGRWPALLHDGPDAAALVERLFALLDAGPPPGLQPDNLTALVVRPLARHADETALPLDAEPSASK